MSWLLRNHICQKELLIVDVIINVYIIEENKMKTQRDQKIKPVRFENLDTDKKHKTVNSNMLDYCKI